MRKSRSWSADDDRRLAELRTAVRTIRSIAAALKRTAGAVESRLYILKQRLKDDALSPSELNAMVSFNPYEPAMLHDRLTNKIETWTGEDGAKFCKGAIFNPDGTVEWKQSAFDGWSNVLGG